MRLVLALLLFAFAANLRAAEPDLKPADTYAVIAGVLQWPVASRINGFPTKNRKDEELYETLRARGVPAENMKLLLDEEATYSGVKRAIKSVAGKAPAGSTLIFYYCGHGAPVNAGGELCLMNYDIQPQRAGLTGLLASNLTKMIQDNFKGKRVLFLADCCFSGGLGRSAEALHKAGFETAAITSSNEQVVSTLNWTFTQTVIDSLKGDSFADANGDGLVSLAELATEVKGAMAALERQPSGTAFHGWNGGFNVSIAKPKAQTGDAKYKPGDYVVVPDARRAGRILAVADGKFAVQFYDYTEKNKIELPAAKLEPLPEDWSNRAKKFAFKAEKAEVEVEWNSQWFPATILKKDGEKTLIHYIGFDSSWDEWVTKERIRPLSKPDK